MTESIIQPEPFSKDFFMSLNSSFLRKFLSAIAILAKLHSAGFRCRTKHHIKYSLSSIFSISINPFLEWCNYSGNIMHLLPAKGLCVEILIA